MESPETRVSLLRRVRDGENAQAWREFDARYRDLILRYCRRRGVQPSDAEDVRQLVMLWLSKNLPEFEYDPDKGRFRNYLGRVVHTTLWRHLRSSRPREQRLDTVGSRSVVDDSESAAEQLWISEWVQHHFRLALDHVRTLHQPRTIEIFEHLVAGHSVEDTALSFGASKDSVYKAQQRIREQLRTRIREQVAEEDDCGR